MEKKNKGKLKIFFGYSAGVGKTYAMLEAAQLLKKQQVDVVVGSLTDMWSATLQCYIKLSTLKYKLRVFLF
ncbi:hypothetical protein [Malacoplasma iowae]|uniref:hypothetical protein n=1 Tax=Malacoplasma iowae TaxID=2116 RepID=UPI002A18DA31|nr:hypothetical protein [Malacoplasma iowae]WPL37687.1 hypothetical protein QX182_04265 [Malacoplasma iowae]WPL40746.1 hypothetical protein QX184_04400 [Malacoplasma iowae]